MGVRRCGLDYLAQDKTGDGLLQTQYQVPWQAENFLSSRASQEGFCSMKLVRQLISYTPIKCIIFVVFEKQKNWLNDSNINLHVELKINSLFIYLTAINYAGYAVTTIWRLMNNVLERMWQELVVTCLKLGCQRLSRTTDELHRRI
jgi:hypothetical protein